MISRAALVVAFAAACSRSRAPGPPPPTCADLPPRDCTDRCAELDLFQPSAGPGYEDVPLDDEETEAASTSYLRRDLTMLVKYAAAKVACLAPGSGPLALGDMSDRSGAIPGTAKGAARHPAGTHVGGRDIDLGYFQIGTPDNNLRAVCPSKIDGVDQHHCIGPPDKLDERRTALLVGTFFESPHVRVVGVDGLVAPPLQAEIKKLCRDRWIPADACQRIQLAFEAKDTGRGWFYAHHEHLHVSWAE